MKGKVQTVLGWLEPEKVGFTLPHEHLLHNLPAAVFKQPLPKSIEPHVKETSFTLENLQWIRQYPYCFEDNIQFCDSAVREAVREELVRLQECCIRATIVDNGSVGLRAENHAAYLKELSEDVGVNIVLGTGFYVSCSQTNSILKMTQEAMENKIREDILTGVDASGVKCGVIGEIGCSWPLLPFERKSLRASATVQRETGCPVIIHPGRSKHSPTEIVRIFQEAGGNIEKTIMSHLDRTFSSKEDLIEFARMGSLCEFDLFGSEVSHYQLAEDIDMPSDAQRINLLRSLKEEGLLHRVVASHDIHTKHRLGKFGGHGYSHLFLNVVPKMLQRGFKEEDVHAVFFENPQKWLIFQ